MDVAMTAARSFLLLAAAVLVLSACAAIEPEGLNLK
jgi:hypothetical protein